MQPLSVRWAYENPERKFPYLSSAAVTDDLVILGGRDKLVHAIDRESGKVRWTFATRGRVDGSPVVSGDLVFVGSGGGEIVALELTSGKVAWSFDTGAEISGAPSLAPGRLLVGTSGGQLLCFGPKAHSAKGAK